MFADASDPADHSAAPLVMHLLMGDAKAMATPGGLEPPTNSLEGCCSNPLSYGAVFVRLT
jgi:hypothetical protein